METSGNANRVAGRDYLEFNFSQPVDSAPLVAAQRQQLNGLVRSVANTLNEEPRLIWRHVHAVVGVESVGEITRDQFLVAKQAIQAYQDDVREDAACQKLVGQILRLASEHGTQKQMESYCLGLFGVDRLKELDREQLAQVYDYLANTQVPEEQPTKLQHYWQLKPVRIAVICAFAAGFVAGFLI